MGKRGDCSEEWYLDIYMYMYYMCLYNYSTNIRSIVHKDTQGYYSTLVIRGVKLIIRGTKLVIRSTKPTVCRVPCCFAWGLPAPYCSRPL